MAYSYKSCAKPYQPYTQKKQKHGTSKEEISFYNSLKIMLPKNIKILRNDRTILDGKELDVYIPELKLAFEFNGTYFHSDAIQFDPNYHKKKSEKCESQGIKLIQIFSDEWEKKRSQVIDLIRKEIEVSHPELTFKDPIHTVYAKSLKAVDLPLPDGRDFFSRYDVRGCLQGVSRYVGLVRGSIIYFVIAIREDINRIQIVQHCSARGVFVEGAVEKVVRYLDKSKELELLLDRRLYTGADWISQGFEIVKETEPNMYVTLNFKEKFNVTENGYKLSELNEAELHAIHYYRVFDSGNLILKKIS